MSSIHDDVKEWTQPISLTIWFISVCIYGIIANPVRVILSSQFVNRSTTFGRKYDVNVNVRHKSYWSQKKSKSETRNFGNRDRFIISRICLNPNDYEIFTKVIRWSEFDFQKSVFKQIWISFAIMILKNDISITYLHVSYLWDRQRMIHW